MTGGLIQLAAQGVENVFINKDPQITFFKMVYRRHTNFSVEPMRQLFIHDPKLGKKRTCIIAKNGDLISKVFLVVNLPKIKEFTKDGKIDNLTKFAWARKIGFALINYIEVEIGGKVIDRHYGEWMNILYELTTKRDEGMDKLIGNIDELYEFTNGKDSYRLYIPLSFWFCKSSGLALPLVSMHYSEVKINIEFNDLDKCSLITPTNYIEVENDYVNFEKYEYIEQNVDGKISTGMFIYFDEQTKRLYYNKISREDFQSKYLDAPESDLPPYDINGFDINKYQYFEDANIQLVSRKSLVYSNNDEYLKYNIIGTKSNLKVMPKFSTKNVINFPKSYTNYEKLNNIDINDSYLMVDYVFLDEDERKKFTETRHDYLIEQLFYMGESSIENSNVELSLDILHPSKYVAWITQFNYLTDKNNNDHFNYSDDYKYEKNKYLGKSLITEETISLNGTERVSKRFNGYFNYIQPLQHFYRNPSEGINVYSFSLFPEDPSPSGSCNMSQIDLVNVKLSLNKDVSINKPAKFRGYSVNYNILRIINGLTGLVFDR